MFVKLSRNDEIAAYVARIMKDEDSELQRFLVQRFLVQRFLVQLMSRIPSDCWQDIESKAREIAAEKQKKNSRILNLLFFFLARYFLLWYILTK